MFAPYTYFTGNIFRVKRIYFGLYIPEQCPPRRSRSKLPMAMEEVRNNLNKMLAPYEQITRIQLYPNEFEKTPKRSIKRYLYDN